MAVKKPKKEKIQFGTMVRVVKLNKSGVVVNQLGRHWLVTFPDGTSTLHSKSELEVNQSFD